jgi:hypothetical protein
MASSLKTMSEMCEALVEHTFELVALVVVDAALSIELADDDQPSS